MNESAIIAAIESMVTKAEKAEKSEDALRFSQAACNAANALRCVTGPKSLKDSAPARATGERG